MFMSCYICSTELYTLFLFFKQKTAYELRISDWSSDVCSSDLAALLVSSAATLADQKNGTVIAAGLPSELMVTRPDILAAEEKLQIGRASGRERVCQYV